MSNTNTKAAIIVESVLNDGQPAYTAPPGRNYTLQEYWVSGSIDGVAANKFKIKWQWKHSDRRDVAEAILARVLQGDACWMATVDQQTNNSGKGPKVFTAYWTPDSTDRIHRAAEKAKPEQGASNGGSYHVDADESGDESSKVGDYNSLFLYGAVTVASIFPNTSLPFVQSMLATWLIGAQKCELRAPMPHSSAIEEMQTALSELADRDRIAVAAPVVSVSTTSAPETPAPEVAAPVVEPPVAPAPVAQPEPPAPPLDPEVAKRSLMLEKIQDALQRSHMDKVVAASKLTADDLIAMWKRSGETAFMFVREASKAVKG